jgi:hypothetical protein
MNCCDTIILIDKDEGSGSFGYVLGTDQEVKEESLEDTQCSPTALMDMVASPYSCLDSLPSLPGNLPF